MKFNRIRPKRYRYSLEVILTLLKQKLKTSGSFRAVVESFFIANIYLHFDLGSSCPTHTTLINWVHKIGYYQLTRSKDKADDWVIILDESIQLGKDKILVILGIRESEIDFTRPLEFTDLTPFRVISKENWNGELISEVLVDVREELGNIKYAVGDYGSSLKKGLKLAEIPHIHDITHKIALILEKLLKDDATYKEVTDKMSNMRIKFSQSNIAHIIPTKQRKKSRYQNIKTISDWCMKGLNLLEKNSSIIDSSDCTKKMMDSLQWLTEYEISIKDLSEINDTIKEIEKIVKSNGLSHNTVEKCNNILSSLKTKNGIELKAGLNEYFKNTVELLPTYEKILCTSDIIESAFGKYKNYVSNNPMAGVTNLALCIPAFTSQLNEEDVKKAFETTTVNDIKQWTKENIGETLFQKRKEAFEFG